MIRWWSEIWDDTMVLWNMVKHTGVVKYGKIQYCCEIGYDTAQCSSHSIAISTNKTERHVSIYVESASGSLRTVVL
jgi:hypothetical protein